MTNNNKTSGKLSIKDCKTSADEDNYLRKQAKKALKKCKQYERDHEKVPVRVDRKTTLFVEKEKYLANKEYYDGLFVS